MRITSRLTAYRALFANGLCLVVTLGVSVPLVRAQSARISARDTANPSSDSPNGSTPCGGEAKKPESTQPASPCSSAAATQGGSSTPQAGASKHESPASSTPPPSSSAPKALDTKTSDPDSEGTQDSPDRESLLYMEDGQLRTHLVHVFVAGALTRKNNPRLRLISSHAITVKDSQEDTWFGPAHVATDQTQTIPIGGTEQLRTVRGTVLLFDLSTFPFNRIKPMTRVTPVLEFNDGTGAACTSGLNCHELVGEEVNLGNPIASFVWSTSILVFIVLLIWALAASRLPELLSNSDTGRLSLSRFQALLWTLAVMWVVLGFSMTLKTNPDFPWQIIALLGLPIATGMVSYSQERAVGTQTKPTQRGRLIDLITGNGGQTLDLGRTQMLAWTLTAVILFVSKSILQGKVWAVPTELVGLMGISQAGYLIPKKIDLDRSRRSDSEPQNEAESAAATRTAAKAFESAE